MIVPPLVQQLAALVPSQLPPDLKVPALLSYFDVAGAAQPAFVRTSYTSAPAGRFAALAAYASGPLPLIDRSFFMLPSLGRKAFWLGRMRPLDELAGCSEPDSPRRPRALRST